MRAFSMAVRALSVIPWPEAGGEAGSKERARAAALFPLAGLALGAVLVALEAVALWWLPAPARNALLVAALVLLTGGRHLGDLIALAGRLSSAPEAAGAAAVGCVLLLKFAALSALPGGGRWAALILAPALGRAALVYLLTSSPGGTDREGHWAPFASAAGPGERNQAMGWAMGAAVLLGFVGGAIAALAAWCLTRGVGKLLERAEMPVDGRGGSAGVELVETLSFLLFSGIWGG